ncbi:FG-GAP-like repeat-containing protein [Haloferula sp.]|uniref:FG-GAP-like repeat-containing protein n=1 Tax=Haloferula sp. TaxID=2497595 RepID=UPI00329BC364
MNEVLKSCCFLVFILVARSANAEGGFKLIPPEQSGLRHVCPIDVEHPLSRVYFNSAACGGVVAADFTGNGKPELFFINGPGSNKLYREQSRFSYEDVTELSGISDLNRWGNGAAAADIDNDGDLDIYLCNYDAPNELWINVTKPGSSHPTFEERAAEWGLDIVDASVMPAFADYDRDGLLDVYLLTHRLYREGGRPKSVEMRLSDDRKSATVLGEEARYYDFDGFENGQANFSEVSRRDILLKNNGSKFVDVSEAAGVGQRPGFGNSVTWWDWNRDGYPDIFVGNDLYDPDFFYLNRGDGSFVEVLKKIAPSSAWTSMGAAVLDVDNNGWTELIMADMSATSHYKNKLFMGAMGSGLDLILKDPFGPRQLPRNAFYLNQGGPRLLEIGNMAGVSSTDWTWAVQAEDFDQDGWQDLFFANGMVRQFTHSDLPSLGQGDLLIGKNVFDFYKEQPELREENLAFRNRGQLGELGFENVSAKWGLNQMSMSFGASAADLDRDGDLDLIVTNLEEPPFLYENTVAQGNSIQIQLRGKKSNKFGLGARVEIHTGEGSQTREIHTCGGYLSTDEAIAHFGIGEASKVDRVKVLWPSGAIQEVTDLEAGKIHTIDEPDNAPEEPTAFVAADSPAPIFKGVAAPIGHLETEFDDFEVQPLLPKSHTKLGPGVAWGDVTGDGLSELVYGGSKGNPTKEFRVHHATEFGFEFLPKTSEEVASDLATEAMGVLLFDADGDGDQDLYIASGSVESEIDDPAYEDRLYVNDGAGKFTHAKGALPKIAESTFSVVTADYDRDGDLDLAVGGRIVPGEYPVAANSRVFRNDQGKFADVTRDLIPGFLGTGLVTSLLWTDCNHDGWIDLIAAHEWGPIKVFLNEKGKKFVDHTEKAGVGDLLGWWQGIQGRDLNGDGFIDYVATNFGTNTIYHASPKKPELIFYGDMAGTGKSNIIEAKFEGEVCYPRRGYSCSSNAIPQLKNKIKTFEQFAVSSLDGLYPKERLDPSLRLECNTLETTALMNDGSGHFTPVRLPWMAQVSPSFGLALTDVDADGLTDLFLAQNFSQPQRETGPMNPGYSALLRGTGNEEEPFEVMPVLASGILIPNDGRSVAVCDVNGDARPDLFVGVNSAHPSLFINRSESGKAFSIRLKGGKGNPTGIGARVTVKAPGFSVQSAEIYGGGGYLSQSEPVLYFAAPESANTVPVTIRWSDGSEEQRDVDLTNSKVVIERK